MVEVVMLDDAGQVAYTLRWRKQSREVCYRFPSAHIAKAGFKALVRATGVENDTWRTMGI